MIEVVDPDDPWKLVDYGKTGRTRLTTLTKEFFMPRFLERDECERERPCEQYPWDGVRNVRPFSRFQKSVVEGVYWQSGIGRWQGSVAISGNTCCIYQFSGGAFRIAASIRS